MITPEEHFELNEINNPIDKETKVPKKYEPPKPDENDTAYVILKAGIASIPYIGGTAAEVFSYLIVPPIEKRKLEWMNEVANALRTLENNHRVNLEELQSNESFITILMQASSFAVRNHQKEKLTALRNAVINSAIGIDIKSDIQQLFIRYIDELIPMHLILLNFLHTNESRLSQTKSYEQLYIEFNNEFPKSIVRDEFKMLFGDIATRGLIRISSDIDEFNDLYRADSWLLESVQENLPRYIVTNIGNDFLNFIKTEIDQIKP